MNSPKGVQHYYFVDVFEEKGGGRKEGNEKNAVWGWVKKSRQKSATDFFSVSFGFKKKKQCILDSKGDLHTGGTNYTIPTAKKKIIKMKKMMQTSQKGVGFFCFLFCC